MDAFVGVVIGGVISLVSTIFVQRMQSRDAIAQKQAEWAYQRALDAARFQRDALAELQDRVGALVSAALIIDDERRSMWRRATPEERQQEEFPPTERYSRYVNQRQEARARVIVLGARVDDESVRRDLGRILDLASDLVFASLDELERRSQSEGSWKEPSLEIVDLHIDLNKRIGVMLRQQPTLPVTPMAPESDSWWRRLISG